MSLFQHQKYFFLLRRRWQRSSKDCSFVHSTWGPLLFLTVDRNRAVLNVFAWLSSWWFDTRSTSHVARFAFFGTFEGWYVFWSLVRFSSAVNCYNALRGYAFVIFFVSSFFRRERSWVTSSARRIWVTFMWFCSHFFLRALRFLRDLGTWSTLMYLITSRSSWFNQL